MRHVLWLIAALLAVPPAVCAAGELRLAGAGDACYQIVLPAGSEAPEATAAAELNRFLNAVTGVDFPVVAEPGADGFNLWVGASPAALARFGVGETEFEPDEILLEHREDGEILLAGDRPRGTLYAVYDFLENECGVRFWTSGETDLPSRPDLTVAAPRRRYAPPFRIREVFLDDFNENFEFSVRRRNNGHHPAIPAEWGGHETVLGFVHTFDRLIPASEFMADHPEWFSLVNGWRQGGQINGQLCLTNAEMTGVITQKILEQLRRHPETGTVALSQNDNLNACQCESCLASDQRYASCAGTLLAFVNRVAEAVEEEFPDVRIETLAYQYTLKVPEGIRPRHNVVIRLCSIECDFSRTLSAPENAAFGDLLRDWNALTDRLAIWDYTGNYSNHFVPYPNWASYAGNIRFLAGHGVRSIFSQGIYGVGAGCGDLVAMRGWVLSRLLWDPALDQEALIHEFVSGYYGAEAAPSIKACFELLLGEVARRGTGLPALAYVRADQYLPLPVIAEARRLWREAWNATTDPVSRERIHRAMLGTDVAWLEAAPLLVWEGSHRPEEFGTLARDTVAALRDDGIVNFREGIGFDFIAAGWLNWERALASLPPEELRNLPQDRVRVIQDAFFSLAQEGSGAERVAVEYASDGQATRIPNRQATWALQYELPDALIASMPRCRIYLLARCDRDAPGVGASAGCYNRRSGVGIDREIPATELAGGEFRLQDLGVADLAPGAYLYVSPADNPEAGALYCDAMILVADP